MERDSVSVPFPQIHGSIKGDVKTNTSLTAARPRGNGLAVQPQ
jgi:hypothetical protein